MPLTITLDDDLAGQLVTRARTHDLSVQDFSVRLITEALRTSQERSSWEKVNSRRLDLIARKFTHGLSEQETAELDQLQEVCSAASAPMDQALLVKLADYERRASDDVE